MKILLVEDESLLAESITAYLIMNGYLCEIAYKDRIISKESIIEHLWDSEVVFSDSH